MTTAPSPPLVTWIYDADDERIGRELMRLAGVLATQGVLRNRELYGTASLNDPHVVMGEIVVFLVSPAALADWAWRLALDDALRERGPRLLLVLVRSVNLDELPPEARRIVLPKDGVALAARSDVEEAMLEVIGAVDAVARYAVTSSSSPSPAQLPDPVGAREVLSINEIFRLNGPPSVTFVTPPGFRELQLDLKTMGAGLILEGPSKTGKSTAVRKAMEVLGVAEADQLWWTGQEPPLLEAFRATLAELPQVTRDRWLFIDDFHYLEDVAYRQAVAFMTKILADQPRSHAKIVLIGINPLGESLLQTMPDLAGRFRVVALHRDPQWEKSTRVAELIVLGERAANIRFSRRDEFVIASRGSFFIAQLLCNKAARLAQVFETQPQTIDVEVGPSDVIASMRDEMAAHYRAPLLRLAAYDSVPRPRGAGLSLLWLLARSSTGFVAVHEAELRFPKLRPVFDWYLQSNLTTCFAEHPALRGLIYFNRATGTLTMEDPQLEFYLRNLDWREFAEASGHGHVEFHPDDGPIWPIAPVASAALDDTRDHSDATSAGQVIRLLHLSDLHFSTIDQATIAYSQLADDLRQQGVDRLDAVVVSGDLVNRATPAEYSVAATFLEHLRSGFGVKAQALVLVPGNHDVNWVNSEAAYLVAKRTQLREPPAAGTFFEHTREIIEYRDEERYRLRLRPFADFYEQVRGEPYPLGYEHQATVTHLPDVGLLILGLNSAWELDHNFRDRASIHMGALSDALLRLPAATPGELRIATFHHPLHSDEDSRIRDSSFLQRLALAGFRLVLHGHVHKADATSYRYDRNVGGRQLEIVSAGTFGAPVREWVPGYPLQYNLLSIGSDRIVVDTRCRSEVNGAWMPDARWLQGPGEDPLPRYTIPR
jgi:Calcineurin-like phosphoesterase